MRCNVCKKTGEVFKCDACEESVCKACMSLTSCETRVLELKTRVLKFYCKQCSRLQTCSLLQEIIKAKEQLVESKNEIIEDKNEIIATKDEIISMLKSEIEILKSKIPSGNYRAGYSEAIKRKKTEVLVVKPKKTEQESSVTKQVVEEKIDPSTLGVGIARIKYVKEGGLAISCRGERDVQSVRESVGHELGEDYEVKVPAKKNPRIKVFNIDRKLLADLEEFVEKIIIQNTITTPQPQRVIKVIEHYEDKKGRVNVVVELDPVTYGLISGKDVIYIGWRTCRYVDHINIIQCYRCWRFGHMAKHCNKKENVCSKCAGGHRLRECTSEEEICVNCRNASEVLKIPNIDYRHTAINKKCEAYRRVYEQLEQRVNYPELYEVNRQ